MTAPGRPLRIGVSACFFHKDPKRPVFKGKTLLYLEESLAQWVMRDGTAHAYLIPSSPKERIAAIAAEFDGLLLQGGSDVAPETYGETPMKPEWSGDAVRDQYEIALVEEFVARRKPVLGVCRGAQIVNVAFGGTLYQDVTTQVPASRVHRDWEIYDQNFHEVAFEPGSQLSRLYEGLSFARVNSVHHQAVKVLGRDLVVEARSVEDGIIEAVRGTTPGYVFAVQWHPEFQDPADRRLLPTDPILEDFFEAMKETR
jgi:putative glutamine amidotransferase